MTVRISVDRLIVDAGPGVDGELFAAAVVRELHRLAQTGAPPMTDPGRELVADLEYDPEGAGRIVAAAVHTRLLEARGG
jgi:hypothetical protein